MIQFTKVGASMVLVIVMAPSAGCTSFGPWILSGERVNYNAALQIQIS